ncbi:MAG: hypothetical protein E7660_04670 [Ruminococcaceae bacterium]|nr:hypothetical protein [Oscillospiraceae bacterium]
MKLKRILSFILVLITVFSLSACASKKAQDIDLLEGEVEVTIWHSEEPYRYELCFTEDNRFFTVRSKVDKKESGTYTLNDKSFDYAKKTGDITLTEEEAATVRGYVENLDYMCLEKGEYFKGPNVELRIGDKTYHFTYGQCLDRDYDNLISALIEYSKIPVTDASGSPVVPATSTEE